MILKGTIEVIIIILILTGTILSLLSSFGFIRLPDVYTRVHASAKSVTLGVLFILVATFLYYWAMHQMISIRVLLGIVFVFITAPVSAHMVCRSAYRSGVELAPISAKDELKPDWIPESDARAEIDPEPAPETEQSRA